MLKPIGEAQFLITVEGLPGTWDKMTAPKTTVEKIKYVDPTKLVTRTHTGALTYEDITLTRKYDAVEGKSIISWIDARRKGSATIEPFVVTVSPVYADVDGTPYDGSAKFNITGCRLLDATYPGMDRESKNLATIEIVFTYEAITAS
jgi:hypothetical protein